MMLPKKLFSYESFRIFVFIFLAIQVVTVGVMALYHNPNFDFDESNTIRISSQAPNEILEILSLEQNFPAYYFFLHLLFEVGVSIRVVILGQYILWLISIYLFYKIAQKLSLSREIELFLISIYSLSSRIWLYAFYVRMYLILVLVYEVMILLLASKIGSRHKAIWISTLSIIACAIHPSAVFAVIILSLPFLFTRNFKAFLWIISTSIVVFFINIAVKGDFISKVTNGTEYLSAFYQDLGTFVGEIFSLKTVMFPYLLIILAYMLRGNFKKLIKNSLLDLFLLLSFLFVLTIGISVQLGLLVFPARYLIFLTVPLLLAIGKLISFQPIVMKYFFIVAIFALSYWQNSITRNSLLARQETYQEFCRNIQDYKESNILTDFHTLNLVSYCLEDATGKTVLLTKNGITSLEDKTPLQILKIQSVEGGRITPSYREQFTRYLSNHPEYTNEVKEKLNNLAVGEKLLYAIININVSNAIGWLSPHELEMFKGFRFESYQAPSLYVFERTI